MLCVTLSLAPMMTSLVTTRREGRTWYLVRSRVMVTSLFLNEWLLTRNDRHKLVSKNGCLEPRKIRLGLEIDLISLDDDTKEVQELHP